MGRGRHPEQYRRRALAAQRAWNAKLEADIAELKSAVDKLGDDNRQLADVRDAFVQMPAFVLVPHARAEPPVARTTAGASRSNGSPRCWSCTTTPRTRASGPPASSTTRSSTWCSSYRRTGPSAPEYRGTIVPELIVRDSVGAPAF